LQNQNSVSENMKFRYEAPKWFNDNLVRIIDWRLLVFTYNSKCQKVTSSNKRECAAHFKWIINFNAPQISSHTWMTGLSAIHSARAMAPSHVRCVDCMPSCSRVRFCCSESFITWRHSLVRLLCPILSISTDWLRACITKMNTALNRYAIIKSLRENQTKWHAILIMSNIRYQTAFFLRVNSLSRCYIRTELQLTHNRHTQFTATVTAAPEGTGNPDIKIPGPIQWPVKPFT